MSVNTLPRLNINVLTFALTVILSVGGAVVAIYTAQASTAIRLDNVEKKQERTVTREEIDARLKAIEQQLDRVYQKQEEMQKEMNRR